MRAMSKKQCSLRLVRESVRPTKRVLLGDTGQRERLAREPCEKKVMLRDVGGPNLPDVTGDLLLRWEVRPIGLPAEAVPLAGMDTSASAMLETQAHAADPGKQVDEGEVGGPEVIGVTATGFPNELPEDQRLLLWKGSSRHSPSEGRFGDCAPTDSQVPLG